MIKKAMAEAINDQIKKEFYSAYLYLSMASYFEVKTLPGFATWMRVQAQEETAHAMIFFNYLSSRGEAAILQAIDAPPSKFSSPLAVCKEVLKHEEFVTASIHSLMDLAVKGKDYGTMKFLDWFVEEQIEEEATASTLIGRMELIKDDGNGLFMMDKELGARIFTPPLPLGA